MFAAIAYFTVGVLNKEIDSEAVKQQNSLYKDFMVQALKGNRKASDLFSKISLLNDKRMSVIYGAISRYGELDFMPERDWDRNIANFDYELGCIGFEVSRETSAVVRF